MKTFLLMAMFAIVLPFAACTDVSHTETTKKNWDGSVTHQDTTVKEYPNGTTSVEQNKSTVR